MEGKGIYEALAAITQEIGAISKNKQCTFGANYKYRGIDDVYNALNPLLGKHGVFVLPMAQDYKSEDRTTKSGATNFVTIRMTYRFCHKDGSFVECAVIGEAMDKGDKATNKAMAIAHKYAILQTFCVPTEDMEDPDAVAEEATRIKETRSKAQENNPTPATGAQRKALFAIMGKKHGNDRAAILADLSEFFGREIKSSNELTKEDISEFLDAVNSGREAA